MKPRCSIAQKRFYDREYRSVTEKLKEVRKKKEHFMKEQRLAEVYDQRVED